MHTIKFPTPPVTSLDAGSSCGLIRPGDSHRPTSAIALPRSRPEFLALFALIATMIGAGIVNEVSLRWSAAAAWPDGILCMSDASPGSAGRVIPVASYPLANVPGKRVTVVRVIYGPGGFTPPHYHAGTVTAYIVRGAIRSQLQGGPVETFTQGAEFLRGHAGVGAHGVGQRERDRRIRVARDFRRRRGRTAHDNARLGPFAPIADRFRTTELSDARSLSRDSARVLLARPTGQGAHKRKCPGKRKSARSNAASRLRSRWAAEEGIDRQKKRGKLTVREAHRSPRRQGLVPRIHDAERQRPATKRCRARRLHAERRWWSAWRNSMAAR